MKVKMIHEAGQPIREYSDNYGNRLIEQGKAVFAAPETPVTPEVDDSPQGEA